MNNTEAKIRFFSCYSGQRLGVYYPDPQAGVVGSMAYFQVCGKHPIADCQLILRPATAMTGSEREELLAIKSKGLNHYSSAIQTIDYLRSKGFLIDFMGFNPVHEFWAVTF